MANKIGIYIITNNTNGKKYVGQSINIDERIRVHSRGLKNSLIGRAVNKYGWDNFSVEIIEVLKDELDKREIKYIKENNCRVPNGYNIQPGGHYGIKPMKGKNLSEEHKKKISEAMKGKQRSKEHCDKIRERMKGNQYTKGQKRSEETIQKMRDNATGRYHSEEVKKKISKNRKGKPAWNKGLKKEDYALRKS